VKASLNIPDGNFGGGSLTIYSSSSNIAMGLGLLAPIVIQEERLIDREGEQEEESRETTELEGPYTVSWRLAGRRGHVIRRWVLHAGWLRRRLRTEHGSQRLLIRLWNGIHPDRHFNER